MGDAFVAEAVGTELKGVAASGQPLSDPFAPADEPAGGWLDLAAASRHFQSNGRRPHIATMDRWAKLGCGGVVLKTKRFGWRRVTCREWIEDFINELSSRGTARADNLAAPAPTWRERRKHATEAARQARELAGVG